MLLKRTEWDNDPDKIHQEIVYPEVVRFGTAIWQISRIVIKEACCVIQRIPVEMAHTNDHLKGMLQGVPIGG